MNAHCERIIDSIRREVLDHVLIANEAHAREVRAAYKRHHNEHRPHQARHQLPPEAHEQPATVHDLDTRKIAREFVNTDGPSGGNPGSSWYR